MSAVILAATVLLGIATLLPRLRSPHWLIRGMDFPRLQLAVVAIVILVAQLSMLPPGEPSTWGQVAVTLSCLTWHLWWILPYTRLWPIEVQAARTRDPNRRIRILNANVLTSNRNAEKLLAMVHEYVPDVLVTLESDSWWQDHLDTLEPGWPHTIKCPLDNLYGMHVYSRLALEQAEVAFLVEDDKPSMHALVTLRSGDQVRVHFLHPAPPSPTENPESSERDAELVIVARSVARSDQPLIVTGDLNDVAWSQTTRLFRRLSGLLDPRVGRGMFNTFHAGYLFLRWPLDHVFHSAHFVVGSIRRLPPFGSDHFALLAELYYEPESAAQQDGLEKDAASRDRAREIARETEATAADVPRPRGTTA